MKKILVAGDVMLDSYWKGESSRLSPEAPVPVVKIGSTDSRLGGAANVALNLIKLDCPTVLYGLVGADTEGCLIRSKLAESGIEDGLVTGSKRTIHKIRVVAHNQQIVRADFEESADNNSIEVLTENIINFIPYTKVLLLSDYKKGALSNVKKIIDKARSIGVPVLIDPKGLDYEIYKGATVITPNKLELSAVVGPWSTEKELRQKAQGLRKKLEVSKLLLTRSEEGMTLFGDGEIINFPAQVKEVYDVSGAGDTVLAVLGLLLAQGYSWIDAVEVANEAAGIVVGRFGTAPITAKDLW